MLYSKRAFVYVCSLPASATWKSKYLRDSAHHKKRRRQHHRTTTTKCGNGSTGGRSSVTHAGATAPGLIRCTNHEAQTHTQPQPYAPQPAPSTRHQGGFGVKRKAHGAWGLGGPAPRPASPTASNQPVLQPAQPRGLAVPLRPNTCSAEGIGPRKGKGRAEEAPSLLPRLLSPLVGSTPQNFRSLRRWGLLCCI
jgi:hypothetical protein